MKTIGRIVLLAAALLLLQGGALGENKVFLAGQTEPFPADAQVLTLRVMQEEGGDCMLLTLGENSMFVDVGLASHHREAMALLKRAGLGDHVDAVYNTHPHDDHIEGFPLLLEAGVKIDRLYTCFPHDYHENMASQQIATLETAQKYGVEVVDLKAGDRVPFGDAELTVYRIPEELIEPEHRCNDLSGALMVRYGDCSLFLTGDLEWKGSRIVSEQYDIKTDILQFPHHGTDVTYLDFLYKADPEVVFFTNGAGITRNAQQQLRQNRYNRMMFAAWGYITLQTDGTKWIASQDVKEEFEVDYRRELLFYPWE